MPEGHDGGGKGLAFLIFLALLIGAGVFLYDKAPDWYDEARDSIQREIDKLELPNGERAVDEAQEKATVESDEDPSNLTADGRSNLPGGRARIVYTPLDRMSEYAVRQDIDNKYDGSSWILNSVTSEGLSSIQLGYYTFVPPIATAAERDVYWNNTEASLENQFPDSDMKTEDVTLDGVDGRVWRFENAQKPGETHVVAWFLGPTHSFSYFCTAAPGDDAMQQQCEESLDSLELRT